jgi:hypothetical protein
MCNCKEEKAMWRLHLCQWIAGDPGLDDRGKCGLPVSGDSAYCSAHRAQSVLPPDCPERLAATAQLRLDLLIAGLSPRLIDCILPPEKELP